MKPIFLAAALAAFAAPAFAEATIEINEHYARSSNPQVGAAFMGLTNTGEAECTLTEARAEISERVELHTHREDTDGVVRMLPVEEPITIAAGETHMLERGADHIMFLGLHEPLEQGDQFEVVLDFGDCGEKLLELTVDNDFVPADAGASHGH